MPIKSMTGFGSGTAVSKEVKVTVELSTVNRKQLDIHLRLPKELLIMEPQFCSVIQQSLARGRVNGEVQLHYTGHSARNTVQVDQELAGEYLKKLRKAAAKLGLQDDLSASNLLQLPQIVSLQENPVDAEAMSALVVRAMKKALKTLVTMRTAEGKLLAVDLTNRLKQLEETLKVVRTCAPDVAKKYHRDLQSRIAEAGFDLPDNDEKLLKEVAFFADRSDITEEITRLGSHITQGRKLLRSAEPVGRALDFLAQEMFREINTIGSKASNTAIINKVITFKTELERFREQVQNIE